MARFLRHSLDHVASRCDAVKFCRGLVCTVQAMVWDDYRLF